MRGFVASGKVISLEMRSRRDYTGRVIVVYWMPAVLWAAVVLSASSDLFSAMHTGAVLGNLIQRLLGHGLPPPEFNALHFLIRKAAHLTEFFILGALLFRALRGEERGWRWRWAVTAVVLAAAVASLDEWHQTFVPSRTGNGWDAMLDTVGATLAQWRWRRC
jgi:VanZ family protein